MSLQAEFQEYERQLPRLLEQHNGQFAVISGAKVQHFSKTYEDALTWGYEKLGLTNPFLVQEVKAGGDVAYFTRDLGPCRR